MIRILAALCLLAWGVGSTGSAVAFDNTLRVSSTLPLDIGEYEPNQTIYTVHQEISPLLFPRLVRSGPSGGWVGEAARSWFTGDDGHSLHFRLRDDLRWSNGKPVTAEDFARAFRRMLHPLSPKRNLLMFIRNAGDYDVERNISRATISTSGPYELVLGLDYPSAGHIDSIGATYLVAIPEGMDEEPSWLDAGSRRVTGGPFRPVSVTGTEMLLDRDENNPLSADIQVDRICIRHVDMATAISDYVSDHADLLLGPLGNQRNWLLNRLSTDTQKDTGARMYMAIIHRNSRVLGDRNVRRALSLALDRETFGRNLFGKTFALPVGIIPDGISGYVADASVVNPTPRTYEDRLDLAKELIAGSGYDASNPIRIRLIYASQVNGYREIASFLKASWKNIHVDLDISTVEDFWKSIDIFNKSSYDVVISSTFDEMPLNYLESLLSKTFASRLYVNPELQELRHAVSAAVGDEQRMKGLQAFDRYITQTFAAIPIATDRTVLFAKPYVDTSMSRSPVFRISHARLVPEKIPAERP